MLERIENYIEAHHLLRREDPLIVAVSGGADSLCLLDVLYRLGYQVNAVHVQHHLRETAERDARFTEDFCRARAIPFLQKDVDVNARVQKTGESVEEAARILRYQALEEARKALSNTVSRPVKVALAHHKNDQAETVLFHLIRGSDVRGLSGIRPERDSYVRPLLSVTRAEIEAYLSREGIAFCVDETNRDLQLTRNRMRETVLPALLKIRPDAVEKIAETAERLAETDGYLSMEAGEKLETHASFLPSGELEIEDGVRSEHPVLKRVILREALRKAGAPLKDVTRLHLEEMSLLLEKEVGKRLALPGGTQVERTYRGLVIRKAPKTPGSACADPTGGSRHSEDGQGDLSLTIRTFPYEKGQKIPEKECTKWFDYDKIKGNVVLRQRLEKDVFSTREGTHKKLKDWMIDAKIPKAVRDGLPVVADEEEVLWVPGYRRGESKKITDGTKTVLELTVEGPVEHAR